MPAFIFLSSEPGAGGVSQAMRKGNDACMPVNECGGLHSDIFFIADHSTQYFSNGLEGEMGME